ncbi:hypothetical protein BKK80_27240 [Cupriavidus malaysiensis]|uniref:Uncharacterized protein n=1 Tax=Cupriavidus malaysiensis TaxID=367825 RepID=A0ABM6FCG7_9BURK|nr:hypothetical protein BKK80_27240 [Cupriavidus malaysiensis]
MPPVTGPQSSILKPRESRPRQAIGELAVARPGVEILVVEMPGEQAPRWRGPPAAADAAPGLDPEGNAAVADTLLPALLHSCT